ncbi:hypothetical protein P9112_012214 [Eukaryota sp. TZLM1-RC]
MYKKTLFKSLQSVISHLKTLSHDELLHILPSIIHQTITERELVSLIHDSDKSIRTAGALLLCSTAPFNEQLQELLFLDNQSLFINGWCCLSIPRFIKSTFEDGLRQLSLDHPLASSSLSSSNSYDVQLFIKSLIETTYGHSLSPTSIYIYPPTFPIYDILSSFAYPFPDPKYSLIAFRSSFKSNPSVSPSVYDSVDHHRPCSSRLGLSIPAKPLLNSTLSSVRPSSLVSAIVHESYVKHNYEPSPSPIPPSHSQFCLSAPCTPRSTCSSPRMEPSPRQCRTSRRERQGKGHSRIHEIATRTVRNNVARCQSGLYVNVLPTTREEGNSKGVKTLLEPAFGHEELSRTKPGPLSPGLLSSVQFRSQKARKRLEGMRTDVDFQGIGQENEFLEIPRLNLSQSVCSSISEQGFNTEINTSRLTSRSNMSTRSGLRSTGREESASRKQSRRVKPRAKTVKNLKRPHSAHFLVLNR